MLSLERCSLKLRSPESQTLSRNGTYLGERAGVASRLPTSALSLFNNELKHSSFMEEKVLCFKKKNEK